MNCFQKLEPMCKYGLTATGNGVVLGIYHCHAEATAKGGGSSKTMLTSEAIAYC